MEEIRGGKDYCNNIKRIKTSGGEDAKMNERIRLREAKIQVQIEKFLVNDEYLLKTVREKVDSNVHVFPMFLALCLLSVNLISSSPSSHATMQRRCY